MKKFIKVLALIVDLAFLPVRVFVGALTVLCGCIVYEFDIKETLGHMVKTNVYLIKEGWKPALEAVFKD